MMAKNDTAAAATADLTAAAAEAPAAVETQPPVDIVGGLQADLALRDRMIDERDAEIARLTAMPNYTDALAPAKADNERLQSELTAALAKAGRKAKAANAEAAVPVDATPDARVFASGGGAAGADFDGETPQLTGKALWEFTQSGHSYILFGDAHHAFAELSPVRTNPEHWQKLGERMMFIGTITLTGSNLQPGGLTVSHFALAPQPDGPVVSLCEIPGGASVAAGREFAFAKGNILFG